MSIAQCTVEKGCGLTSNIQNFILQFVIYIVLTWQKIPGSPRFSVLQVTKAGWGPGNKTSMMEFLLQTTIIAFLWVSDILHMYIDFYSTSLPFPLIYLRVFMLMSTFPSEQAKSSSSTAHSGHAATPEERRKGWDRHWAGLGIKLHLLHTIFKSWCTISNSQGLHWVRYRN